MPKFNKDRIMKSVKVEQVAPENEFKVGAGLLSETSKLQKAREMELTYIEYDEIDIAEENKGISINDIEELAESIKDVGLLNPLIVKQKEDGRYKIVAGQRRYTAIGINRKNGVWDRPVRAFLFDPQLIDLPLDDSDKEDYVRATENSEQRNQTDGDRLIQMRKLKAIYEKLRENGTLTGVKTRELLAADMKLSESRVAQIQTIENKGTEALKEAVEKNQMSISTAVEATRLTKEEQEEFILSTTERQNEPITKAQIAVYKESKKKENIKPELSEDIKAIIESKGVDSETVFTVDSKLWGSYSRDINKQIKKGVILDEKAYGKFLDHVQKATNILLNYNLSK